MSIEIVESNDLPEDAVVICMPAGAPTPFTDNVAGQCSMCSGAIIHRPHVPPTIRKVCIRCLPDLIAAEGEPDDVVATREQIEELRSVVKRVL
jgi:hypothetical protein